MSPMCQNERFWTLKMPNQTSATPPRPHTRRPIGQVTRGKTALNRLRQVDVYLLLTWLQTAHPPPALIVDVGYGAYPWTALEMLDRWQKQHPALRLLGVEIDPARVAAAQPYTLPGKIDFRLGGFNLSAVLGAEQASLIRAYNVLRQYDEAEVMPALALMAQSLAPNGLLIEGTSTPAGRLVVFDVYQNTHAGLVHREMVFGTNFRDLATPVAFQAILPKRLIHHARDPRPAAFFHAWIQAAALARATGLNSHRREWIYAVRLLRERFGYAVDIRSRIVRRGYLALRDPLLD